jgi:hypothetical protein
VLEAVLASAADGRWHDIEPREAYDVKPREAHDVKGGV